MTRSSRLAGVLLVACVASVAGTATLAQNRVLVVDGTAPAPGEFAQIQDAVLAASDGDKILVRRLRNDVEYASVDVVGKALTIAAFSQDDFVAVRGIRVRNLSAGKAVVLSRLWVNRSGTGHSGLPGLWLEDDAGSVRAVACILRGQFWHATPGVEIESSAPAAFARCEIVGGAGGGGDETDGFPGGTGLVLEDSLALAHDSTITGGLGGPLYIAFHAGDGGAGARLARAALPTRLLLAGSSVRGGTGGELELGCDFGHTSGGGGDGVVLGAGTSVECRDSFLAGGPGGVIPPCGTRGPRGDALVDGGGTLTIDTTPAVRLETPTIARERDTITLKVRGTPGDRVTVLGSLRPGFRELADGVLLVKPEGSLRVASGTIGPSGTIELSCVLSLSLPARGGVDLWLQALARHADGKLTLGSFSVVTVLDSAL